MDSESKNAYKKGGLTDEQIERLEMIGMPWMNKQDRQWMEIYRDACAQYKQRKNTKLSKERKELLDRIGMIWEEKDSWTQRYELAKAYYIEHENLEIPADYKTENSIWLGKRLYEQRKNKDSLSDTQINLLNAIDIEWRLYKMLLSLL